ncbi:hypothetical protein Sar04_04000 [Salinispora arenicola]|uniref:Uncharacterized protein n=1 Tax=Salinispora arenicola TaxID=168697 RepID=A0ABQ4JP28_SALAC|nr:hypothetical protein Sar04_04000 [Salinispora arenicola]
MRRFTFTTGWDSSGHQPAEQFPCPRRGTRHPGHEDEPTWLMGNSDPPGGLDHAVAYPLQATDPITSPRTWPDYAPLLVLFVFVSGWGWCRFSVRLAATAVW